MGKSYRVYIPGSTDGITVFNLKQFCRERGIDYPSMGRVARGERKSHIGRSVLHRNFKDKHGLVLSPKVLHNMIKYFHQGWNPENDKTWIEFKDKLDERC